MNSKYLMIASATTMGLAGLTASFLPQEIINAMGMPVNEWTTLFIQILGALYLGFALMNWMAKSVLIGGIYARPLAIGNLMHFAIGALAMVKKLSVQSDIRYLWVVTIGYVIFALLFGYVFFNNPTKKIAAVASL